VLPTILVCIKEATHLYREALKSLKSMKDFDKWIDVPTTLSPSHWFNDLINALAKILPKKIPRTTTARNSIKF